VLKLRRIEGTCSELKPKDLELKQCSVFIFSLQLAIPSGRRLRKGDHRLPATMSRFNSCFGV
jgi:hypothetical protein